MNLRMLKYIGVSFLLCLHLYAHGSSPLLQDAPLRYTIKPGDTLWGIASRYLKNPWAWQSLFYANPAMKNPRHLRVGAVLYLHKETHPPYIQVLSNGTVKLLPGLKAIAKSDIVPSIPLHTIEPFLDGSIIFDENRMAKAPYVIEYTGQHLIGAPGDEIYVTSLNAPSDLPEGTTISYKIFRPTKIYFDLTTRQNLGYAAALVGKADLVKSGQPATLLLTNIKQGIKIKDRVLQDDNAHFNLHFKPQTPLFPLQGSIIDLLNDHQQGARNDVVVIDKGENVGLRSGDVLAIYTQSRFVQDPIHPYTRFLHIFPKKHIITLPKERIGELMIFRVFSKTSLALIVRSTQITHIFDGVTNP